MGVLPVLRQPVASPECPEWQGFPVRDSAVASCWDAVVLGRLHLVHQALAGLAACPDDRPERQADP
jgi:hypothetical protein